MTRRVAYLNTQYPALSHTFIEREVRSLRALGYEVQTYSVRAADPGHLIDDRNRKAFETTAVLLDPAKLLTAEAASLVKSPVGWLRGLATAWRLRPDGLKGGLLALAYHAEAMRLAQELKKSGLSHVHVHMANNGAAVAAIACACDPSLSYSVTVHGPSIFFKPFESKLGDKIAGAKFVRVISDFCRSQAMSFCDPEHWPKLHVVHCGMEPGPYVEAGDAPPPPGQAPGASLGDARVLRLVNVARLAPVKGHTLLIEAVALLRERGVQVEVDIIGGGPLKDRLHREIDARGVSDRVRLVGPVGQDKMPARFAAADGFVLPSFAEGVPTVLMESMAAGKPVVATAIAGTPELVEDGVHGKLVRPGSAEQLADGLAWLAERSIEERIAMGRAGREKVLAEFDVAGTVAQMAGLFDRYLEVAQEGPADRPAP
ncbi:MAG: glycosyltransferase family 4 protein [Planctomycetota bacterium]